MSFASFDTEKLIVEIERRPSLWDTSHSDYANEIIKIKRKLERCLPNF